MRKRIVSSALLLALIVNLFMPLTTYAESTNRNEVRAQLSNGGWSVVYGDLINEADYALFIAAVASAVACECPTPIYEYFDYQLQEQITKIERSAPEIAQDALVDLLIQAFNSGGQTLRYGGLEVSAGLATYKRWDTVIYDEPRTYQCKQDLPFGGWTWSVCTTVERVERTVPWPNNFQPYFRFRWVANNSNPNPGNSNGGSNSSQPSQLNEVWRVSIPQDASDRISELYLAGSVMKQMAFTSDNGWVILFNKNEATWNGIPEAASDKILELNEAGVEIKQIAFTPDNGWVILYNKNAATWRNIPDGAANKIRELSEAGNELKQVVFTTDGGWIILFNQNEAAWNGIPEAAGDKIIELNEAGVTLKQIAFTASNGWVILYNYNGLWARGIPQNAFDKMVALQDGSSELKQIAFTANNGSVTIYR